MDAYFPVSGIETYLWLPPLVAFAISFFTSMAGVSGAVLILPFQMSVLGFTSPAVSPTNMVFNLVAIPSGVYRYLREGRMLWPLTALVVAGTVPGVVAGGFIRLTYLPSPGPFKVFVSVDLLYIATRMFFDLLKYRKQNDVHVVNSNATRDQWTVKTLGFSWRQYKIQFQGQLYKCHTMCSFALSIIVGIIGGVYGIGGGAIIAPFFVAIFRLPIYTIAGATLMGTLVTSVVGVLFYEFIAPLYETSQMAVSPDWALGALFGLGGMIGMYLGARLQKFIPAKWIKLMLGILLLFVAVRYIIEYFS